VPRDARAGHADGPAFIHYRKCELALAQKYDGALDQTISWILFGDDVRRLPIGLRNARNQLDLLVLSLERLYQTVPEQGRHELVERIWEGPWKATPKTVTPRSSAV
jgi:hypothetical protein